MKYACGGSSAGCICPIWIVVSGLLKDELPNDDFVVIHIEGLSINGHIDPRNRHVECMCLIGANDPQKHVFDWHNENRPYPTIRSIKKIYNPLSTSYAVE